MTDCVSFPAAWCAELIEFVFLFAHFEVFLAANFPIDVVDNLPAAVSTGIYYGWASVDRGPVYKMVMSIGWNPFYNNTKKSMVGITVNDMIFHSCHCNLHGKNLNELLKRS